MLQALSCHILLSNVMQLCSCLIDVMQLCSCLISVRQPLQTFFASCITGCEIVSGECDSDCPAAALQLGTTLSSQPRPRAAAVAVRPTWESAFQK